MASNKKYDLCVKIGSYEKDGKTKNSYLNIGAIFEGDNGQFMLLNKHFNPAGIPDEKGGRSIIVSMFAPKGTEETKPVVEDISWQE